MAERLPPYNASDLPITSSHFDANYSRTALQSRIKGDPAASDPINRSDWFDPLSPAVTDLFNDSQTVSYYDDNSSEPITTIAYKVTGVTTTWWAILQYNGFMHPDEVPSGVRLRIPDMKSVVARLQRIRSKRGQVVRF